MEIITIDWETYYDKDYSLTKLTTEEYVRDSRFEAIMLGIRMPDGEQRLIEGTYEEIQYKLGAIDWSQYAVLAHNTMFDGAILAWRFGIKPAVWLDTLSMARAMFGIKGNSLSALAARYNLDEKGTYVVNMMGKRRADMSDAEFKLYAQYCLKDVELCHQLFELMSQGWYDLESMDMRHPYPVRELELIDRLIRMYTEPSLVLNQDKLEKHLAGVIKRKEALLAACAVDKDLLMSNPKFAELLQNLGVTPPMKISPATGKLTFAFAKTDPGMKDLLEHPDERVQVLVSARLGVKSTLEETRTTRFIDIAKRGGLFPIPLKYSAARTHRLGGCLVADSVVTVYNPDRGQSEKRIVDVLSDDLVWDGEEFVTHSGVSFSGYSEVISHDGVTGTSDHRVFYGEDGNYREITLGEAAHRYTRIATSKKPNKDDLDSANTKLRSTTKE
jgi:DNA polymerase